MSVVSDHGSSVGLPPRLARPIATAGARHTRADARARSRSEGVTRPADGGGPAGRQPTARTARTATATRRVISDGPWPQTNAEEHRLGVATDKHGRTRLAVATDKHGRTRLAVATDKPGR